MPKLMFEKESSVETDSGKIYKLKFIGGLSGAKYELVISGDADVVGNLKRDLELAFFNQKIEFNITKDQTSLNNY